MILTDSKDHVVRFNVSHGRCLIVMSTGTFFMHVKDHHSKPMEMQMSYCLAHRVSIMYLPEDPRQIPLDEEDS